VTDAARPSHDVGRQVIGIGGLHVDQGDRGTITTHALGSCVGITLWCPMTGLGGMIHCQLPLTASNPGLAKDRPGIYVDSALPRLLAELLRRGAVRKALKTCLAGGANVGGLANDLFNIGSKNVTIARKILWQERLLITGEETGGTVPRTMTLDFRTGAVTLSTAGVSRQLA
jgi:chemotaxis protein CheD